MLILQILLTALLAAFVAGVIRASIYRSSSAYWREYDKAQMEDLKYFREHPGCSYEEAHQYRDAVMKKFHRY